jgi:hypothetical protein
MNAGATNCRRTGATGQRWFRAAANLGHGQAQLMLDRYLAGGVAGEPDPARARMWQERAVAPGRRGSPGRSRRSTGGTAGIVPVSDKGWVFRSHPRGFEILRSYCSDNADPLSSNDAAATIALNSMRSSG